MLIMLLEATVAELAVATISLQITYVYFHINIAAYYRNTPAK
jgi:hypothetical protein